MKELLRLVFVIVAPIVLLVGLIIIVLFSKFIDSFQPTHETIELVAPNTNSRLFIKTESWGVTGDSQLTTITTEGHRKFELDSTSQIIFKGLQPFLYKQNNDTLILCVHTKAIMPKGFKSNWTIIQQEVNSEQERTLRRDNKYKTI